MTASKPNTATENSSDDQPRETETIGAQVRPDLKGEVERLAHEETSPPERNVRPSHVIRAAIRFYIENYEELDSSAYVDGGIDADLRGGD